MSKTRNMRRGMLASRMRRDSAMERQELRGDSEPRVQADGAFSFPSKTVDPNIRAMIDAEVRRKGLIEMTVKRRG